MELLTLENGIQTCGGKYFILDSSHHPPPCLFDLWSPVMATHTKPLKLTRAEITRRISELPLSRQQVRLMRKTIVELRRENALLTYLLSIR